MTGPGIVDFNQVSYTGNMGHDSLVPYTTTPITALTSQVLLEYHAPVDSDPDLPNDPLGYVPVQDDIAGPS